MSDAPRLPDKPVFPNFPPGHPRHDPTRRWEVETLQYTILVTVGEYGDPAGHPVCGAYVSVFTPQVETGEAWTSRVEYIHPGHPLTQSADPSNADAIQNNMDVTGLWMYEHEAEGEQRKMIGAFGAVLGFALGDAAFWLGGQIQLKAEYPGLDHSERARSGDPAEDGVPPA